MKLFVCVMLVLSLTAFAQDKSPDLLKKENASLRMQLAMTHIQQALDEKARAAAELEAAFPGMKWDDQKGTLAPMKVEAKPNPAVDKASESR